MVGGFCKAAEVGYGFEVGQVFYIHA
jgi:hypothetical protein